MKEREVSETLKEQYKERLNKIIGKKFDTTMIFAISQAEEVFGHLWGHNKPEETLTVEEKEMREKWKECRRNILDQGNHQKRNSRAEIANHDVIWKRYSTVLIPRQYQD